MVALTLGMLLASSVKRPRKLLTILKCRTVSTTNYPHPNASSAKVEKPAINLIYPPIQQNLNPTQQEQDTQWVKVI